MSNHQKLLCVVLGIMGVLGLMRLGTGQVDGGGVVGVVEVDDMTDLRALAACLRSSELAREIEHHLDAGESIANLEFRRFSEGAPGVRVYLGSLDIAGTALTFVRYEPGNAAGSAATYVRSAVPSSTATRSGVVPDRPGLDFMVSALSAPSPQVRQALVSQLAQSPLTGLRVTTSVVGASQVPRYRLELFFGDDSQRPKLIAAADLTPSGFSALELE